MSSAKEQARWSMVSLKKMPEKVLVEKDGTVRSPKTLELIGHYFTVDGVIYFMRANPFPLKKRILTSKLINNQ
jgi:hypothetical protein